MLIKEACGRCKLTRKAIEYYEAKGLVHPAVLENGYRDYSDEEIKTLKEISVLRRCGIGIPEIKEILGSENKPAALAKYRYVSELKMRRLAEAQRRIDDLIRRYDIDRAFDDPQMDFADAHTVEERLVFAFPGNYGLFLSMHFGRFLSEAIDTEEKRAAYDAIIKYLDDVELYLTPELTEFLEEFTSIREETDMAELQSTIGEAMQDAIADADGYMERNREEIEAYLAFKLSDDFKRSPAGALQRSLLDFQRSSGYQDVFIANMKILSGSYAAYLRQLEIANEKFYRRFPASRDMYEQ